MLLLLLTFSRQPYEQLNEDSLKTHVASTAHSLAVEADLLQLMSVFHQSFVEKNEVLTTVMQNYYFFHYFLSYERVDSLSLANPAY